MKSFGNKEYFNFNVIHIGKSSELMDDSEDRRSRALRPIYRNTIQTY
jgi:hypothetical protein